MYVNIFIDMKEITKELLEDLYYNKGLSGKKIAENLGISRGSWLRLKEQFQLEKSEKQIIEDAKKWQIKSSPSEQEIINNYLKENITIEELAKRFNIGKNKVHRLLKKYDIRKSVEQIVESREKTCLQKYGTKQASASFQVRQKISQAYSDGLLMQNIVNIKRQNGTLNFSKPEEDIYQLLLTKFSKEDIIRQYSTEIYTYPCDFYIKSLDLYIEYQGSWVHGRVPFDENNTIHQNIVNKWKIKNTEYFNYAVKIWSIRDPLKRKIAKENNLNWIEFFTFEEAKDFVDSL